MATPSRTRILYASLVLALTLAGCAGGGGGAGTAQTGGRRASNRIDAAELATVSELDLYAAVGRLRPPWLRPGTRGTLPQLILDGSPQSGGVEMLRSMRAGDVTGLEFMNASDATTRYGTGYTGGAIIVTTKR